MGLEAVVAVNVLPDRTAQSPGVVVLTVVLTDVDSFCLQAAEPALNHEVICPAGLTVHALTDVEFLQEGFVFCAGELTALIDGVRFDGYVFSTGYSLIPCHTSPVARIGCTIPLRR